MATSVLTKLFLFWEVLVLVSGVREDADVIMSGIRLMQQRILLSKSADKAPFARGSDQVQSDDTSLHPKIQKLLRKLESAPASGPYLHIPSPSLRQLSATPASTPSALNGTASQRVQFLVYSDSQFYESRLSWVRDTWASKLPSNAVHVIGDSPAPQEFGLRVRETHCPKHSHWEGACCKYAEAVILAYDIILSDDSVKWAYFTDDDSYVRGAALQAELLARSTVGEAGQGAIFAASHACAPQHAKLSSCPAGMCAGGGYAASRKAVQELVGGRPADFLREQMANCGKCDRWADLALSKVATDRDIQKLQLEGLYGWRLNERDFKRSLELNPLQYHYIHTKEEMDFLHSLFENSTALANTANPLPTSQDVTCVKFKEKTHCAAVGFPWDKP